MINIVRVSDKQKDNTYRCYCGRPGKGVVSVLGNPIRASNESQRDKCCDEFDMYFTVMMSENNSSTKAIAIRKRINELIEIAKTQDIELACFCQSPKDVVKKRCHTMTIKAYIEQQLEESKMKEFELIGNLGIDKANALLNQVSNEQFLRTNTYSAEYYGTCPYKYTGANHLAKEMPKYLSDLASELEVKENLPNGYFNMVLINRYPSNKGLGRHRDNEPEITALSSIASISLGASRIFSITKGYNNPYLELELTHGDIVMMRGRSQIDYYHAVIPGEGIRFNLTFRHNANAPEREESKMKTQVNEPIGIIRPVVNQMDCVPAFRNELAFLSNMYECSVYSYAYMLSFKCVESAYQAMKNTDHILAFVNVNGYEAKRLGKQVKIRSDWNEVKLSIMEKILRAKFQGELLQKLLAVKGEIVERNNWGDSYWGVCNGKGENHLGKLLMKIRDEASQNIYIQVAQMSEPIEYNQEVKAVKPELKGVPSMTYAGIGSRSTPLDVLQQMTIIAFKLRNDFVLYSGAADGADKAFSEGTMNKVEFIPWKGFNNCFTGIIPVLTDELLAIAESVHPAWNKCSQEAKKLHARNCHQILGHDLKSPVDFVLCWTPDGAETKTGYNTGGTGQAIRLANRYGIPVINMFNADWKQRLDVLLEDIHILNQARAIGLSTY